MAETQKENAAPTSRAARASKRAARGVLRWGETLESLFLLSPDCPERKALAERVVQRPDDPAAWQGRGEVAQKLGDLEQAREDWQRALELLGAGGLVAGYFAPEISVVSASGLSLLMLLGIGARLRVRDPLAAMAPAAFLLCVNAFIAFRAAGGGL